MSILSEEVKNLGERVKKNREASDQERANKAKQALPREITDAPELLQHDFWCVQCHRDFVALGRLEVHGEGATATAVYTGECPKRHRCYRYVTNVPDDLYWVRSQKVKRDREAHEIDMLSPHDSRFKIYYKKQWDEIEASKERQDHAR